MTETVKVKKLNNLVCRGILNDQNFRKSLYCMFFSERKCYMLCPNFGNGVHHVNRTIRPVSALTARI